MLRVLRQAEREAVLDNFQIPSKEHPSDHLPVAALLQFKR
jgi:hypothetical protein